MVIFSKSDFLKNCRPWFQMNWKFHLSKNHYVNEENKSGKLIVENMSQILKIIIDSNSSQTLKAYNLLLNIFAHRISQ